MPTLATYVPDDWPFKSQFNAAIAGHPYRGKPGPYLRDVIENAMTLPQFTSAQINRWLDDETALLEANKQALIYLHNSAPEVRIAAADRMAEIITRAVIRQPIDRGHLQELPMVAEDAGSYGVPVPPKPEIHSRRKPGGGKKSA